MFVRRACTGKDSSHTFIQDTLEIGHFPAQRLEMSSQSPVTDSTSALRRDRVWGFLIGRKVVRDWSALPEWFEGRLGYANVALH